MRGDGDNRMSAEMKLHGIAAKPIPLDLPSVTGWKEVPMREGGEPLVSLGLFGQYDDILTSAVYAGQHKNSPYGRTGIELPGSLMTHFVREGVAEKLRAAQSLLPRGYYLVTYDTYRTLDTQQSLYNTYFGALRAQRPEWSDEELHAETQKYVSLPSTDPTRPSPHNTGGAVDVAIVRVPPECEERLQMLRERLAELADLCPRSPTPEQEACDPLVQEQYVLRMTYEGLLRQYGVQLNFGTPFDYGGPEAAASYLEQKAAKGSLTRVEEEALWNRRLLYTAMCAAGFMAYPDEWWHFNAPECQMGAKAAGLPQATYGAADLTEVLRDHERMRVRHWAGMVALRMCFQRGVWPGGVEPMHDQLLRLNWLVLNNIGDPRLTAWMSHAVVIEPPQTPGSLAVLSK